ncbi:helix-turn-helix domain-containing protein [Streptomyces malaysiensis subsp. malaysiensis]
MSTGQDRRIAEHGPHALSLRGVARSLGMTLQRLYHYFPNRDALLTISVAKAYRDLSDAVSAAADAAWSSWRCSDTPPSSANTRPRSSAWRCGPCSRTVTAGSPRSLWQPRPRKRKRSCARGPTSVVAVGPKGARPATVPRPTAGEAGARTAARGCVGRSPSAPAPAPRPGPPQTGPPPATGGWRVRWYGRVPPAW